MCVDDLYVYEECDVFDEGCEIDDVLVIVFVFEMWYDGFGWIVVIVVDQCVEDWDYVECEQWVELLEYMQVC